MRPSQVLILIPARFASTRFPGKPLQKIAGKSLIERVYLGAKSQNLPGGIQFEIAVVTDDDRIESEVKRFGGKVCRVDDNVETGSERIALAYERNFKGQSFDLILNVQGDEPLITHEDIQLIASLHLRSAYDIFTLVKKQQGGDSNDPNKVKVALSHFSDGHARALYFSRSMIPFDRDKTTKGEWYLHVGVYSYKPEALLKFVKFPKGFSENLEKLEQLRALENGLSIGVCETKKNYIGVDTPEDIKKVEGVLNVK